MGSYTALEAVVRKGKIYPTEPGRLPEEGRLLLIVLEERKHRADPKRIGSLLGWLKTDLNATNWQREIRSEWDVICLPSSVFCLLSSVLTRL